MKAKIDFDFQELPPYIIRHIKNYFGHEHFTKESQYVEWQVQMVNTFNSFPNEIKLNALSKGIEFGKKCLEFHLKNECTHPEDCITNESWNRRISIAETILTKATPKVSEIPEETEIDEQIIQNKDFTTARQVLAMHYLFKFLQVKDIDRTVKANFVEFLTGKNNKNIYDALSNPLSTKNGSFRMDDLIYVRKHFENLGLNEIVKMISNEIDTESK